MAKFYAVRKGVNPGVYKTWDECKAQVSGFPGAEYKSFPNEKDARAYLSGEDVKKHKFVMPTIPTNGCLAFVDGSYDKNKNIYSYGIALYIDGEVRTYCKAGNIDYVAAMNNVAGELSGAMRACSLAKEFGKQEIIIVHDYEGIAKWVDETNPWKANLRATQEYKAFIEKMRKHLKITFVWTKGHAGVEGNELVDKLAKTAIANEFFTEVSELVN